MTPEMRRAKLAKLIEIEGEDRVVSIAKLAERDDEDVTIP